MYTTAILIIVLMVIVAILWDKIKERLFNKSSKKEKKIVIKIDEKEFSKLNKKHLKGDYVKICPKCGSIDVKVDFSYPEVWAAGFPQSYVCKKCNYLSNVFPEIKKDKIDEYRGRINKKSIS